MTADGPKAVRAKEVLGSGKVVLFAVPGAFTPGCSNVHLPGFIERGAELKTKGVAAVFTPGAPLDEITGWLEAALDERDA